MATNPFNIGTQEGTFDYDIGPEIYRDNGKSKAVENYDKKSKKPSKKKW